MRDGEEKITSPHSSTHWYDVFRRFIIFALPGESRLTRYGLAVVTVGVVIAIKLGLSSLIDPLLSTTAPFLAFAGATLVAAWYGGFGPGLFSTVVAAFAANYFFIEPLHEFGIPSVRAGVNMLTFGLEGLLISLLCDQLRRSLVRTNAELSERQRTQQELAQERERFAITLGSIGDAVIATDTGGCITFLNPVAQRLTGWSQSEATGKGLDQVFKIINEQSRQTVESPVTKVLALGTVVGLANHTLLVTKDERFIPIDDSGAPIKNEAGETIGVVLVFRDVTERKQQEAQDAFLAHLSQDLASTLDYDRTVQNVVRLAVPFLADWCSIDLVGEDGVIRRIASAHVDPAKEKIVHGLLERYPYPTDQPHALRDSLLAGHSQLRPEFSPADLAQAARSPEHLQTLKELGLKSGITVPLVVRGSGFGAITLGLTESERRYTEDDLSLAQELARRASLALDNARLYRDTQEALVQRTQAVNFHRQLEEQLTVLVEASDSLLSSLQLDTVLPAILDLSRRLVAANAYGVWRFEPSTKEWRTIATAGLSEEYQQHTVQSYVSGPVVTAPILAEDVQENPALIGRLEMYQKENIRSLLVIPLRIQGAEAGTMVFYYHEPHRFSQLEVRIATALANLAAAALGSAELYEEQRTLRFQAESDQARLAFLAEASNVLASSLNYETTLQSVAELVVPDLSDWCSVHLLDEYAVPQQLALAHVDPAKVEWALNLQQELERRYPYDPTAPTGLPRVLRTGQSELYPDITDEMLVAAAQDEEQLQLLREIGYSSAMIVPLKTRDQVIGALQLVSSESGKHFNERDLELAQELARRAALAVDNARLYSNAQEAISARDEFLSVAAHELKTPVTSLRGFAQLLIRQLDRQGEVDPARLRKGLDTINQQSERLLRLILRLLDISKLEAGRLVLEVEQTDLAPMVERVVEAARNTTQKHLLTVQTPAVLLALVDPLRFEQVVTNLVDNAIKYSPEGGLIALDLSLTPSQWVQLSVKDQGLGVPPEHRERIFQPFYQAHDRGYAGIGMGLYISKEIIELHGGRIEADFPAEGGTCFIVSIPAGLGPD